MNTLVAFFSAQGTTAALARALAAELNADLFELRPRQPYTPADLRYANPLARCNREKVLHRDVPIAGSVPGFASYGLVFLGFPIWYGCAPNVVTTFCAAHDWSGKQVALFATSGGSGMGKTAQKLQPSLKGASILDARVVRTASELSRWARSLAAEPAP